MKKVKCIKSSKVFTEGKEYKIIEIRANNKILLMGDNNRKYQVKAQRFKVIKTAKKGVKKTNKQKLETIAKKENLTISCYDKLIDSLSQANINNLMDAIKFGDNSDILVNKGRSQYVVSVEIIDNELDLIVHSKNEYIEAFGIENYENLSW